MYNADCRPVVGIHFLAFTWIAFSLVFQLQGLSFQISFTLTFELQIFIAFYLI